MNNVTNNNIIIEELLVADSFFKRFKGLMFSKKLASNSGLLIYPCSAIHTFFMKYNIDVLYLDKNNIILAVDEELKPGKIGRYYKGAVAVVELPAGKAREQSISVGQAVEFIEGGGNSQKRKFVLW